MSLISRKCMLAILAIALLVGGLIVTAVLFFNLEGPNAHYEYLVDILNQRSDTQDSVETKLPDASQGSTGMGGSKSTDVSQMSISLGGSNSSGRDNQMQRQGDNNLPAENSSVLTNAISEAEVPCALVKGSWCKDFMEQKEINWKAPPRGSKTCPGNCNTVGNCNYGTGLCECPAGWKGPDCKTVQKRPCTGRTRHPSDLRDEPMSFMDENKRDKDFMEGKINTGEDLYGRCSGICDDDIAMCWCAGPQGRIDAPNGSAPGTPPIKRGRPMSTQVCQPSHTKDGVKMWGETAYNNIYGPKGWCVAEKPSWVCPCIIDGLDGLLCDEITEQFCVNQCSGHGFCNLGFCKCDEGWYGHDCSLKRAGLPIEPSRISKDKWLNEMVAEPLAAMDPPPRPTRPRPLIYIYDLEPLYHTKLLQYRIPKAWCVHRHYTSGNETTWMDSWVYAVETLFHELLAQSEHRTFDPEEADFFYVPQYSSCYPFPIMGWADYPWFHDPGSDRRTIHASNIVLDSKKWVDENYPYWKRRGGKDHIFLFLHDEGACWAPNDVTPSIWLTHWGRLDLDHTSNTGFYPDNYSADFKSPRQPDGWLKNIRGHPCYDPKKDLVIPSFKAPRHYYKSPYLSGNCSAEENLRTRDIFFVFIGDVGKHRRPRYSRGIRQKLYNMSKNRDLGKDNRVLIGDRMEHGSVGDYSSLLARSKYCLVAPGDGWSARAEDSILHGCVPVVIMDEVHAVYESILDWNSFGLRIPQSQIEKVFDILLAIPESKLKALQQNLAKVWTRFRYLSGPGLVNALKSVEAQQSTEVRGTILHSVAKEVDAFATIMQWLHSKIESTR